jgi:hypothetical protein
VAPVCWLICCCAWPIPPSMLKISIMMSDLLWVNVGSAYPLSLSGGFSNP